MRALPVGKRMLLHGAQGGPYANVPPSIGSACHWHPRFTSFLLSTPRWAVGVPTPPRHSLPISTPPPIPWAGPALSPSAQLTDPWPSPPHALHPGLWGCPQGPPCPQTGQPCHLASHPALECWGALSSRAGVPTTGWARGGGHAACFLPCQVPRAPHSPARCRSPAGTCWLARCGPLLPPPPAVQFPVQVCAIPDGGLLGGRHAGGALVLREGPASPDLQSPTSPGPQPSGVDAAQGAPEPSACHPNPVRSRQASTVPATPVVRPQPRRWGYVFSQARPTERGYQGEDRLGRAQHLQVPCRAALQLPQGGPRGADPHPPHPGHQARAHSTCGREEGAPAGNSGVRLASGPAGSLPPGLPPPRGPSAHKSPLWCGISHTPVPPLPRFLAKFQVSCRPAQPPSPCPRQRCWAPSRCHPGRSCLPCPESSPPLQRPCKSPFG